MGSNPRECVVEFYYDISCPFAYIASTRIEALAARTGALLIWRPVLLGAIYRATNAPQGAAGSASDVFNPTKKAITSAGFKRTIKRYGIPHNEPPKHPVKTTAALRLLYFVNESQRSTLSKALFRAYWVEGKDVSDGTVLFDVVKESSISNAASVLSAMADRTFEGEKQRRELETATDLAVKRGSPGVPGFWIPDEVWTDKEGKQRTGRLYWGQDRMHFVEAVLNALNDSGNGNGLDQKTVPLRCLVPRCSRGQSIADDEEVKLEFWYDFSSPWAFLGWSQLKDLNRQFGERLHIEMKPFLLGILFREIGAPNLPMAAISQQKRDYTSLDRGDWVRWWNAVNAQEAKPDKNIDFRWADKFPIRTPTVLRAALVEPNLVDAFFRGCWERNLDVASDDVLREIIHGAGYNGQSILERANESKYKNDLRARTQEAKQVGICGVPSYRVFRRKAGQGEGWKQSGDIVWGQDETAVVEDMIAGWDGHGVADVGKEVKSRGLARL